jgi:hypothetical protein
MVEPCLPQNLRDLVSSGAVTIGEVGLNAPGVQTITVGGGAVIEFNSGMVDFVYAVVRTLAGNMVRVTTSGPQNEPALSVVDVARDAAALFKQWKWPNRLLWTVRRIAYPPFEITGKVQGRAEEVAKNAELFLLAHELGHVSIDRGLVPPVPENDELRADAIGCGLMIRLANFGRIDLADAFGAATLAIRICAALEDVGVQFSRAYPPEVERLKNLRNVAISACPSMQYYHEISRIGVAYEDQMDDVQDHIDKMPRVRAADGERLLVRFIAELLDVALGRLSDHTFVEHIIALNSEVPPEVMRQALRTLDAYYVARPPKDSFIDTDMRGRMRQSLLRVKADLPNDIKGLFKQ